MHPAGRPASTDLVEVSGNSIQHVSRGTVFAPDYHYKDIFTANILGRERQCLPPGQRTGLVMILEGGECRLSSEPRRAKLIIQYKRFRHPKFGVPLL